MLTHDEGFLDYLPCRGIPIVVVNSLNRLLALCFCCLDEPRIDVIHARKYRFFAQKMMFGRWG